MSVLERIDEIRTKMSELSTIIMEDEFIETLKVQNPSYIIEKLKYIKADAQGLIGNVKFQAKQVKQ